MAKIAKCATRKVVVKGIGLLRKAKMKNHMLQAEIRQLKLDMATIESSKVKAKEESAWLKQELEWTVSGFAKEKKELETAYQ